MDELMRKTFPLSAVALMTLSSAAWPAETAYDFVACTHTRRAMLEASPDIVGFSIDNHGVVASSTSKEWEKATTHCVGYIRVVAGKTVGKGLCKWVHASGDTAFGEFEYPPAGEASFTWLVGTGKLKGIAGGGTFKEVFSGMPAEPGTSQACRRDWGKYTLP
jgi:hypothetical protein